MDYTGSNSADISTGGAAGFDWSKLVSSLNSIATGWYQVLNQPSGKVAPSPSGTGGVTTLPVPSPSPAAKASGFNYQLATLGAAGIALVIAFGLLLSGHKR